MKRGPALSGASLVGLVALLAGPPAWPEPGDHAPQALWAPESAAGTPDVRNRFPVSAADLHSPEARERMRLAAFGIALDGNGAPVHRIGEPAGDLDGDGLDDLLLSENADAASIDNGRDFTEARTTISAVRGADGETLWSWTEAYTYGIVVPSWEKLNGRVRTFVWLFGPKVRSFVALDGSGLEVWRRTYPGYFPPAVPAIALGVLPDATGDGIPDLAVEHYVAAGVAVDTVEVLDGAMGVLVARLVATGINGDTWVSIAGDLSGDGLTDLVAVSTLGKRATVTAYRASDGVAIWQTAYDAEHFVVAYPVGDTTGDGVPDIVAWWPTGLFPTDAGDNLALLSGATGSIGWLGRGDLPNIVDGGDIDGDGLTDVRTQTILGAQSPVAVRYDAHRGTDGASLYSTTYGAPAGDDAFLRLWFFQGDANGDGVGDWAHSLVASDMSVEEAVVSGRTGAPIRRTLGGLGLLADVDADGTQDQVRVTPIPPGSGDRVELVSGSDGSVLWAKDYVAGPSEWFVTPVWMFAHDIDADGAADVMLPIATVGFNPIVRSVIKGNVEYATTFSVADGPTGAIRWTRG